MCSDMFVLSSVESCYKGLEFTLGRHCLHVFATVNVEPFSWNSVWISPVKTNKNVVRFGKLLKAG